MVLTHIVVNLTPHSLTSRAAIALEVATMAAARLAAAAALLLMTLPLLLLLLAVVLLVVFVFISSLCMVVLLVWRSVGLRCMCTSAGPRAARF